MSKKLILTPNAYKAGKVYAVKPINGTGDFDFVRNTGRTRVNVNGNIEELSNNIVALDYQNGCPEILLEPQRTNLYLNSDVLVTQDVSTNAESYAVSFNGSGTITFTGSFSGSLTGNGNERVSLVFEATSGTLTSTVTGNVLNAQIENVQLAANAVGKSTSVIPTTTSTVTRNKDILQKDLTSIIQPTYTAFLEVVGDEGRLKIEDNDTGIDLPLNGAGKIAIQVDSQIKIIFPDNGQPQTELIYDKPDDLRNIDIVSKLAATRIGVIAIEDGIKDVSNWISGNVSSYWIETDWSAETDLFREFRDEDWDYFPAIDLSNGTDFPNAWRDNNLTSFPGIDLSSGTNFGSSWRDNNLTSFPLIDLSSGTDFERAWQNNSLTLFPAIDLSNGTNFRSAWFGNNLTSFPAIDLSNGTDFNRAWQNNNLTSFPAIDLSNGTNFRSAWFGNNLTSFPANMFDTNTADNYLFVFRDNDLDQTSVDNILISVNTSAQVNNIIDGDLDISSGTNATPSQAGKDAADALRNDGWTVNLNNY